MDDWKEKVQSKQNITEMLRMQAGSSVLPERPQTRDRRPYNILGIIGIAEIGMVPLERERVCAVANKGEESGGSLGGGVSPTSPPCLLERSGTAEI